MLISAKVLPLYRSYNSISGHSLFPFYNLPPPPLFSALPIPTSTIIPYTYSIIVSYFFLKPPPTPGNPKTVQLLISVPIRVMCLSSLIGTHRIISSTEKKPPINRPVSQHIPATPSHSVPEKTALVQEESELTRPGQQVAPWLLNLDVVILKLESASYIFFFNSSWCISLTTPSCQGNQKGQSHRYRD